MQSEYMQENSSFRRLISSAVSTDFAPAGEAAYQFPIQAIIAHQAMIRYERMYMPVWAALQALITDYADLKLDANKRSQDLDQLIQGTKTFADWLYGFEWEDSYMPCQKEAEQRIDALRGAMENLLTWQDKLNYLLSLDPSDSREKVP